MKKFIVCGLLVVFLLGPLSVRAADTIQELQEQYKVTLLLLIDALIKQVTILQNQLTALLAEQGRISDASSTSQSLVNPVQQYAQETQSFVENTPVVPPLAAVNPLSVSFSSGNSFSWAHHNILFTNTTSRQLRINFIDVTTPYVEGSFSTGLLFSLEPKTGYPFGDTAFPTIYPVRIYHSGCGFPTRPQLCNRVGQDIANNIVNPGEAVTISLNLNGTSNYVPGDFILNYAEGSITDIDGNNVSFETAVFSDYYSN